MTKIVKIKSITTILSIVSLLCFLTCLIFSERFSTQFWLLPFTYFILFVLCQNNRKTISGNPGSTILNLLMFVRYNILPLIYYSSGKLPQLGFDHTHYASALMLMIYEMVCVFAVLDITGRKERLISQSTISIQHFHIKAGRLIALFIVAVLLGIAVVYKDLAAGISVLLTGSLNQTINAENNALMNIIWELLCIWLFSYLITLEAEKYKQTKNSLYPNICSIFAVLFVLLSFIESMSLSRWYTVINAIVAYFCLCHFFAEKKRIIARNVLLPFFILIVVVSAYKNGHYVAGSDSGIISAFLKVFNSGTFDAYFAGINNVNNAIGLKNTNNYGFSSLLPDVLNNMPIINHYVKNSLTTVYGFNQYVGRLFGNTGDQIIPLIGQSSIYFGYPLSPLLSVLSVLGIRYFDRRYKTSNSMLTYSYVFFSVWLAVAANMLNLTIHFAWLYIRLIPTYLIIRFTMLFFGVSTDGKRKVE